MIVHVKLFATLKIFSPDKVAANPFALEVLEKCTLSELVKQLKIPNEEAKICFVNGHAEDPEFILHENDEVGIFPPVGGGS
jgi:molybdopterin converting factor small subunit